MLEILLGAAIGPQVFGWVSIETPVQVASLLGLGFLLFLSGLEVEYERFRGRRPSPHGYRVRALRKAGKGQQEY